MSPFQTLFISTLLRKAYLSIHYYKFQAAVYTEKTDGAKRVTLVDRFGKCCIGTFLSQKGTIFKTVFLSVGKYFATSWYFTFLTACSVPNFQVPWSLKLSVCFIIHHYTTDNDSWLLWNISSFSSLVSMTSIMQAGFKDQKKLSCSDQTLSIPDFTRKQKSLLKSGWDQVGWCHNSPSSITLEVTFISELVYNT